MNEHVWLCSTKTLFIKEVGEPIWPTDYNLLIPAVINQLASQLTLYFSFGHQEGKCIQDYSLV